MRFDSLEKWLSWQEGMHPSAIELGLERIRAVLGRLALKPYRCPLITVAGTNGKGSSVALLESILSAAGYRVGVYTSPHLFRYNERVRIAGEAVPDQALCSAFERVDRARSGISLTYFEFGTLAALTLFAEYRLDAIVLEVGMGGRLDAVNVVDPDVALVTSLAIDHADWLGEDRETIGREKAGIFRAGRPAVCSDSHPPASISETATALGAPLVLLGRDFGYRVEGEGWEWWGARRVLSGLPRPALRGRCQLQNAAGVLMALERLRERLPVARQQVARGLMNVRLAGRFQVEPGPVTRIFDVAHNPDAAHELAANLQSLAPQGKVIGVWAMLADKDIDGFVAPLAGCIDQWYIAPLKGPRGASTADLEAALNGRGQREQRSFASVGEAYRCALMYAQAGDCVVVCGSFFTVAESFSVSE